MTENEYRAKIAELETENRQLKERLDAEVSEVENLTEEIYDLKEEFAEAYAKLEQDLAIKNAPATDQS